jgi:hypothetical protein
MDPGLKTPSAVVAGGSEDWVGMRPNPWLQKASGLAMLGRYRSSLDETVDSLLDGGLRRQSVLQPISHPKNMEGAFRVVAERCAFSTSGIPSHIRVNSIGPNYPLLRPAELGCLCPTRWYVDIAALAAPVVDIHVKRY